MAGVYLHIPFCRRKCAYCDFYSVARPALMEPFIEALKQEIRQTQIQETVNTIYFGGGTPSMLPENAIVAILKLISEQFELSENAEITLEVNPEDVIANRLKMWRESGVNRLSIGLQSLDDNQLKQLKRNHSAKEALKSIELSLQSGFVNISADLIYGLPNLELSHWEQSIRTVLNSGITHLSAYHLSLEPNTLMFKQVKKNQIHLPEEEESENQFNALFQITESRGFPWYEISNFAKPGFESKHNSAYWDGTQYYGFGPSAHSFDGNSIRRWNHSDIKAYIDNPGKVISQERLSQNDKINDYLITSIRTRKGIDINDFYSRFPRTDTDYLAGKFNTLINRGLMQNVDMVYRLKPSGLFLSDAILKDILYI
ncbi:MAG: radical SAM family heme chaperone HemW [Bacteroidales bacterium]|jgi:oxygen-independent coproporphyrinogen-3 oxidase|nr:radical SAM family heme chaperone HemW [Bacteroidales bacterium]